MPSILFCQSRRARLAPILIVSLIATLWLTAEQTLAGPKPKRKKGQAVGKLALAPLPPRSALLKPEDWQRAPLTPVEPGEIDRLIAGELRQSKIVPAPLTSDEQFIRRATLDLTGELPTPSELQQFLTDSRPDKRARLIDRLLNSDAYARHWARYWREVVSGHLADQRGVFVLGRIFENWMVHELKANHSWGDIARAMITATGEMRFNEPQKNGQAFFLAAHRGKDAAEEQAAETSRVFLGIQIQCAQCHDHKTAQWKRVQFHELAGYFARLRQRPVRETIEPKNNEQSKNKKKQFRVVGFELISTRFGEHRMPDKKDPKKLLVTLPHYLNGDAPARNASDLQRRQALAREITSKQNYWFAAAFVNRVWGVLMGQSFFEPVDDMGPGKEAVYPSVLTRLTGSFRGSNYDIKRLFRDIMNSETYQRQVRLSEPTDHLHFAAAYPTRLPADALWHALTNAIGGFPIPPMLARRLGKKAPRFMQGFANLFQQEFDYDPSLKPDEVEGSITQALLLMNNPQINNRLQARGPTTLARILRDHPDNDDAVRQLYMRTLARKPTDRELDKCLAYIDNVGKRTEAFEDIFWTLINSTEFQTKR
ncbi:MAG TPA: DUF1549 domain-containing protein [Gemmataceae bacterium]|nr:DUF1549 domain-containing protein [Gemmataceae bacterium]